VLPAPPPNGKKHYTTILLIPIQKIEAESPEQAETIIQEFIDKIAPIMKDKILWDGADWTITQLTTFD
jgi:hypothetical protein